MKTLLIVYHSMTGGTLQMAQAAATGARNEPALRVSLLRAEDAQAADVLEAGGYIFATICTHAQTAEEILRPKSIAGQDLKTCEELGATMAAGIALGIF
jgi:flavodoxin